MKVVVDTNVIVSGIINPYGKPAHVLNLILNGELILCIDSRIYREYERVLKSPKFSFPEEYVKVFLDFVESASIFVSPPPLKINLCDESDLPFIEVALAQRVPIITGNKKHFTGVSELKIYTPSEFVEWYKSL